MDHSTRIVAAAREACQREALMWDHAVDETEQEVDQLIFVQHPGWVGGRAMIGQIQVDAIPLLNNQDGAIGLILLFGNTPSRSKALHAQQVEFFLLDAPGLGDHLVQVVADADQTTREDIGLTGRQRYR